MILLAGAYFDPSESRLLELATALRRNLECHEFEEVHLFIEDEIDSFFVRRGSPGTVAATQMSALLVDGKITLVETGRRTPFREYFTYANNHFQGKLCVIANSDIWFDGTLSLIEKTDLSETLVSLSKWNPGADSPDSAAISQDAWAFRAPIREFLCDWTLGLPGCEGRLAHEAAQAGLKVINPSLSVIAHHEHASGIRRHRDWDRIAPPYLPVMPATLEVREEVTELGGFIG